MPRLPTESEFDAMSVDQLRAKLIQLEDFKSMLDFDNPQERIQLSQTDAAIDVGRLVLGHKFGNARHIRMPGVGDMNDARERQQLVNHLAEVDARDERVITAQQSFDSRHMWSDADKDPSKDPRIKRRQSPLFSKADIETIMGRPISHVQYYKFLGARCIDPTLSGLVDRRDEDVVRELARRIFIGPKQPVFIRPNNDHSFVRLVAPLLMGKPPSDSSKHVVNEIYGRAQGGKSPEACWAVWMYFFVHATIPTYYVRDSGGLGDAQEVISDFEELNQDISIKCQQIREADPVHFSFLTAEYAKKFMIEPRIGGNAASDEVGLKVEMVPTSHVNEHWVTSNEFCIRLANPQVLVSLANKSHMSTLYKDGPKVKALKPVGEAKIDPHTKLTRAQYKEAVTKFSPFTLMGGKHSVPFYLKSGGARKKKDERLILHSAIPAWAWDTEQAYDQGSNAKKLRYARVLDEHDKTRSDSKTHVQRMAFKDHHFADFVEETLAPEEHAHMKEVQRKKRDACEALADAKRDQDDAKRQCDRLEAGEALERPSESRDARATRLSAEARATGVARRGGDARYARLSYAEDSEEEEDYVEELDDDDEEEDSNTGDTGSVDSLVAENAEEEIAVELERHRRRLEKAQSDARKAEEEYATWEREERQAMATGMGVLAITGQQSAAAFNLGITATIFGCLHRNEGNAAITRLTMMPIPDAYNDLCFRVHKPESDDEEEEGELRLVRDPDRLAGPGDIEIIETKARPINAPPMGKLRNDFISSWLINNNKCKRRPDGSVEYQQNFDAEGVPHDDPVPLEPMRPRSSGRRSYRIDENMKKEPWVKAMLEDYEKAKVIVPKRQQNTWDRNGELFTKMAERLQAQRPKLKQARRCAQALVITNETREVRTKDKLIADMFVRGGEDAMQEASAYNFSHEGIDLYVNHEVEGLNPATIIDTLDHPEQYIDELRDYLLGDEKMDARSLTNEMLQKHYIRPIRKLAAMAARRNPREPATPIKPPKKPKEGEEEEDTPIEHQIWFEEKEYEARSGLNNEISNGLTSLTTFKFMGCKLPKFMATLFTMLDARRHAEDPEALPLPFIGMTKNIGGRAKRYMCHGYRSRIQVMCHTTDIFPNKRLGLAMSDGLQEAFRVAGFDDVTDFGTDKWMSNWVRQEYVTTQDFLPLLKNALKSHDEYIELSQAEAREDEEPMDTLLRVMVDWSVRAFKAARTIRSGIDAEGNAVEGGAREPTSADMPPMKYPNLLTWLTGHVNRCAQPFLRHSTLDKSEKKVREEMEKLACEAIAGEFSDDIADQLRELNEENPDDQIDPATLVAQHKDWYVIIPLPQYSEHHAPGGTLQQRDEAELRRYRHELHDILSKREEISRLHHQWAQRRSFLQSEHGRLQGHRNKKERERGEWIQKMTVRNWPASGAPPGTYTNEDIKEYKKFEKQNQWGSHERLRPEDDKRFYPNLDGSNGMLAKFETGLREGALKEGPVDVIVNSETGKRKDAGKAAVMRFRQGLRALIKNWQRNNPDVPDQDIPILSELIDIPWAEAFGAMLNDGLEKSIADIKVNFGRWKEIMRDPDYGDYLHEPKEGNDAPAEGSVGGAGPSGHAPAPMQM